jgi:prepilin-type N-terminal cleavage/methylation domain-containing protein
MKCGSQKGFTLLELIVVVTVVAALAAIAIPQYTRYRDNAEKAAMISDCHALYRAFVVFYLDHEEYPYKDAWAADPPMQFDLNSFAPLTLSNYMGGSPFDIDIERFRDKLAGRQAEAFDSPDDLMPGINNQEFYIILPWAKDPSIKFVVASSDNVLYADNTPVDGGNWLDGVYITKGGAIIGQ